MDDMVRSVSRPLHGGGTGSKSPPFSYNALNVLLKSNGLNCIDFDDILVDLAMKYWDDPDEAAKNIVRTAYKKGSEDNLTVTLLNLGSIGGWE